MSNTLSNTNEKAIQTLRTYFNQLSVFKKRLVPKTFFVALNNHQTGNMDTAWDIYSEFWKAYSDGSFFSKLRAHWLELGGHSDFSPLIGSCVYIQQHHLFKLSSLEKNGIPSWFKLISKLEQPWVATQLFDSIEKKLGFFSHQKGEERIHALAKNKAIQGVIKSFILLEEAQLSTSDNYDAILKHPKPCELSSNLSDLMVSTTLNQEHFDQLIKHTRILFGDTRQRPILLAFHLELFSSKHLKTIFSLCETFKANPLTGRRAILSYLSEVILQTDKGASHFPFTTPLPKLFSIQHRIKAYQNPHGFFTPSPSSRVINPPGLLPYPNTPLMPQKTALLN